jgi:hypothetical protein
MKKRSNLLIIFLLNILLFPCINYSQWTVKTKSIVGTPPKDSDKVYLVLGGAPSYFHNKYCKLFKKGEESRTTYGDVKSWPGVEPCPICYEVMVTGYDWNFALQQPSPNNGLSYVDDNISIVFLIDKERIGFEIQNKSDAAMKINWDEVSFISPDDRASRVIHSGIRLIEKDSPQTPTLIPPNSRIKDFIVPSDNIVFSSGWKTYELFPGEAVNFNGKKFTIYFPMDIKGNKKEYSFSFNIIINELVPYIEKLK